MLDIFLMPFMLRAFAAGLLIAIAAGYFGVFIVQRKMSFLGSGLAHSAFGGVALGLLLSQEPLVIAVPFTLIISLIVVYIQEKTKLEADSAIGIIFSVSVALGIIFLYLKDEFATDAFAYLFGSILAVENADIYGAILILVLAGLSFPYFWPRWTYASFDRDLARSDGLNVTKDDYILSVMIALTIVISIKIIGIILISSFLVLPAASAKMVSGSFSKMTVFAILFAASSSIGGIIISVILDFPTGAVIILFQALLFVVCAVFKKV